MKQCVAALVHTCRASRPTLERRSRSRELSPFLMHLSEWMICTRYLTHLMPHPTSTRYSSPWGTNTEELSSPPASASHLHTELCLNITGRGCAHLVESAPPRRVLSSSSSCPSSTEAGARTSSSSSHPFCRPLAPRAARLVLPAARSPLAPSRSGVRTTAVWLLFNRFRRFTRLLLCEYVNTLQCAGKAARRRGGRVRDRFDAFAWVGVIAVCRGYLCVLGACSTSILPLVVPTLSLSLLRVNVLARSSFFDRGHCS